MMARMYAQFHLSRGFAALFVALWLSPFAQAQELTFTLVEQFVIGDDEEAPTEYVFTYPEVVRTDSKGNIYVHDRRRADIRVFDATGRYVATVGKRGAGPGEMRHLIGMHVDDQDRLIVSDQINARYTIFTELGRGIETKAFAEKSTVYPDPILSLGDAFVIRYVRLLDNPEGGRSIKGARALHLHDSDLNLIESFAKLSDIFDFDRPFLKEHSDSRRALQIATNGTDTIVLAPSIYSGYLYRYTRSDDGWIMKKLQGGPAPRKAYISVSETDWESNRDYRRASIVSSTPTEIFRAKILHWSRGVAVLSTGEIVNYTRQTPLGESSKLQAELFDQNGSLVGYGPFQFADPELNESRRAMTEITILWTDVNDRVYLRRRNEQRYYVLSVAELEIGPR